MGKAKPANHTSAELKKKAHDATVNRGGGAAGLADRRGGAAGSHAKYKCPVCGQTAPDLKTMSIHHEAKHPKLPYEADKVVDLHAAVGGQTTVGVGVRGSTKK